LKYAENANIFPEESKIFMPDVTKKRPGRPKKDTVSVTFDLHKVQWEKIRKLVHCGDFTDEGQFLKNAVRLYLKQEVGMFPGSETNVVPMDKGRTSGRRENERESSQEG